MVAIIDRATNKVVGAIDSGSTNAHRLIIAPDGQRLYTENEEDGEVSVIDLPNRKLLGKIKTPHPLAGITISGDGATVTVVSDQEPVLFLIDTKTQKVRETVRLKDVAKPAQIARYSPDWRMLGVTSLNSDTVSLIDPSFREQTASQGRQSADGHGLSWQRTVRRLPGRRLGPCDRYSGQALEAELPGRHRL